jgi:FtsP/CotA-like multicopper oxidase with cupredoxin domain
MNMKAMIIIALVSFAGILTLSFEARPVKASTTWNYTLYGRGIGSPVGWGFTNDSISNPGPAISVNQGDVVNLTLITLDGAAHHFVVDYNGNDAADVGEPDSGIFTGTTHFQFTADLNGTFSYICAIHFTTMRGGFTVVPEFPTVVLLPIFILSTLLVAVAMRKHSGKFQTN